MTAKSESALQVRHVLDEVKAWLASDRHGGLSEADTRAAFLDPLLAALGYHALGDISREVTVSATKEKIDYLLKVDGTARIAVEAKSIDQPITDAHAAQVIQYASLVGVEWVVATNAREWRLYHQFAKADLSGKHIFTLDLVGWTTDEEFDAIFEQLWLLSHEAFTGSDGPAAWLRAQKLDSALRDSLTNPASDETEYLRRRLDRQGLAVTAEQVAAWFKARLLEPAPGLPGPPIVGMPMQTQHAEKGAPRAAERPGSYGTAPGASYWVVPVAPRPSRTAQQCLHDWLEAGMWGLGESTPGRKAIQGGDWIAFYVGAKTGSVVAYARVTRAPNLLVTDGEWPEPDPMERPYYKVPLADVAWLSPPVRLDSRLRGELDAFNGRDPDGPWSWLVQTTRRLSDHDFQKITGRQAS